MPKEYAWRERTSSKETEEEEERRRTVHFFVFFVVFVLFCFPFFISTYDILPFRLTIEAETTAVSACIEATIEAETTL